ncbi:MAG: polyphosphate kinase 1 [Verrucomicrobia bacterium]|nr:MAG: polyphosphate kinase 1 [Verrucomicrobiota bacterium]
MSNAPATNPTGSPFINRELSWLEFNQRVLDEACCPSVPLLERVKFLCITHSNLDEFFEVRVAGLKQQVESDVSERSPDGLSAAEALRAVTRRVRELVKCADQCWRESLGPELAHRGIVIHTPHDLGPADLEWLDRHYRERVHPVLTPLAVDPSHPFPQVLNKSLNLITRVTVAHGKEERQRLAIVQVPRVLPRLVRLPRTDGSRDYVFLSDVIGERLGELFPGSRLSGWSAFRVTRNSELYIDEDDVANLLKAVEAELHNRRKGEAVRLEVSRECPEDIRRELLATLGLKADDLYVVDGPLNPTSLLAICDGDHAPELRDPPFPAPQPAALRDCTDLFGAIRERDHLLHHPYESFETVVRFLETAAVDPRVLAIKQTLYRTGGDARIVGALMSAVRNGKQVTAVVELKARFDEANNIRWARALEEAGVHVVYGLVGYKIHCKVSLVVRNDEDGIRRYLHLGTGNYNPSTARLYTDLSLLTCRPEFGEDATNLFNLLTGICQFQGTRKLVVAPFQLHERVLELIERETRNAREELPARIVAKMNSLVDTEVIEALYRASRAGVRVELIVRGICCLRPGIPGTSENIHVRSVVDRFLEHSRIWCFENSGRPEVFVGSADWMPRNFFRRIEVAFPVEDGVLRNRIIDEILGHALSDNTKARVLQPDGTYVIPTRRKGVPARRCQTEFVELALGTVPAPPGKAKGGRIRMKVSKRPS